VVTGSQPKIQSFRDLIVWQRSIELVAEVYRVTKAFPKDEIYGLTAQMRRAAVSVPSNIAEGQGRLSTGEFLQFLGNARGSLHELQTQVVIGRTLGFLAEGKEKPLLALSIEVDRMLNRLLTSLRG
jgi:four helix bundle protein